MRIFSNWQKMLRGIQSLKFQKTQNEKVEEEYKPVPDDYPTFPPATPQDILEDREGYSAIIKRRKFAAPQGVYENSSLYALYRLYEYILLDNVIAYRNLLEWFWRQSQWSVHDIPDPQDREPTRYAFLSGVTYLMVRSYNARVKLGLVRDASTLLSMEEVEANRTRPDEERVYERVPEWAGKVPPLADLLRIRTHEGVTLDDRDDKRADEDFLAKNILLWTPHIYFT